MKKKVAIVSQAVDAGGVGTLVHFIYDVLAASAEFEPTIVSIATSSRDAASTRLVRPISWLRGVQIDLIPWRKQYVPHVGARFVELEFMRYRPRAALTRLLQPFDLVQVVCGSPAVAHAAARVNRPICITAASLLDVERRALMADAPRARRTWSRAMTVACRSLEASALRRADHVFAISHYTYQLMNRYAEAAKLSLTPSGIDTVRFKPAEPYAADGHLIAVGRWSDPRKNLRMLLRAYHQLRQSVSAPRLVLVGQAGPTEADWALATELGIADDIDIHINVSLDELAQLYREASLFLMSSDEEGLGIVLLEAMACGVPVISTRSGGPEMLVNNGKNGYLINVGDVDELAQKAKRLLGDVRLRSKMSAQARTFVEEHYSFERVAADYLNVYRTLLN